MRSCLPTSTDRTANLLDLGAVDEREGRYDEAVVALETAERLARDAGDVVSAGRAIVRRQFVRSHAGDTLQSELQSEVEALLPELERAGDDAVVAEAFGFLGISSMWLGRDTRAIEMLERALEFASRSGDARIASEAASWIPAVLVYSPVPATAAYERWRRLTSSVSMSRYGRAFGDSLIAVSLAMMERFDDARVLFRDAHGVLAELGDETHAAAATMQGGNIELMAGDFEAARRILAEGDRALERLGEGGFRSTVLCMLADALQALGRSREAIEATDRAEGISSPDDFETNSSWRAARARALADLGEYEGAEGFAREAMDVVAPTETVDTQARAWASLGYVLASASRTAEALEAYGEALELYERKDNAPSVRRVRQTIAILRGEDPGSDLPAPGAWGTTWPRPDRTVT